MLTSYGLNLASHFLEIKVFRDVVTCRLVATDHWMDRGAYETSGTRYTTTKPHTSEQLKLQKRRCEKLKSTRPILTHHSKFHKLGPETSPIIANMSVFWICKYIQKLRMPLGVYIKERTAQKNGGNIH